MMFLAVRVIDKGKHPPLLTRDDLLTMIRVEDQFSGRQIRRLLTDLHHTERTPIELIADDFDVSVEQLKSWMYWLHVEVLEIALEVPEPEPEEVQPAVPSLEEPRQSPLEGVGAGITAMRIIAAWNKHQSWVEVAKAMEVPLNELSEWVNHHRADFAGRMLTEDMSWLLSKQPVSVPEVTPGKAEKEQPLVQPEVLKPAAPFQHPAGIVLTVEAQEAIKQYCIKHGCTERELFTDQYKPTKIADISSKIGIGVMVYLKLVEYYRGTIAQTVGG